MRVVRALAAVSLAAGLTVGVSPSSYAGETDPATAVTAVRSPANQLYGFNIAVVASLNEVQSGEAIAGQPVTLERRLAGASGWTALETKNTLAGDDPNTDAVEPVGSATFRTKALGNAHYRVVYAGAAGVGQASTSRELPLGVFRRLGARPATQIGDSSRFAFFGKVTPGWAGKPIALQKKTCFTENCKWIFVTQKNTSSTSNWRFEVQAKPTRGLIKYRAIVGDSPRFRKSPSAVLTLRTR